MADTSSKHNILVTDNGSLKNVNKGATELKNTLDAAGTAAERTAAKVKKASAPTPVAAARAARDQGGQAAEDSGTARGVGGLTGAAGRDFAKQSQGLGGLVRLYATFAANIFAATAAFGALSRAMDTTNMIKGLDQLGAATGRNLGNLAKQVTAATDGAISLRESMEAVSKASAAGMSNTQILAMSEAAKKASQVLGVNMTDAVSRLTRGISKLEPELLDELGLFTKVDKSTQDYAKSIGKSTAALTDFEKRQAFANAVLKEAKDKFSAIDIPANPYSKLLASFQNVAQAGLELVNKVLGPLVNILSQSPTALAAVMGLIGAVLLKTAIPAIGMWKDGLKNTADEARKTAKAFRESFGDEFQDRMEARFNIPDIRKKLATTEAAIIATQKRIAAADVPTTPSINKLKAGSTDANDLRNAAEAAKRRQANLDKEAAGGQALSDAKRAQNQQEIADINKLIALKEKEIALIKERTRQQKSLGLATATLQDVADKPLTRFDPEKLAENKVLRLEKAATKGSLVASAATNASIIGVRNSMALLNKEITEKGLVGWDKWSTQVKGGAAAIMSRVMGIADAFSNVAMVVGIAIAAFQLLDGWWSKNSKQLGEYKSSMEALSSAIDNVGRTLDVINSKDPLSSISTESINARATAVNELASAFENSLQKLKITDQTANSWDRFIDGWKSVTGSDLLSTSAKDFSLAISKAIEGASGKQKTNATQKLIDILGVNPKDFDQVFKLLSQSPQKLLEVAPKVSAVLKQLGIEMSNIGSRAKQLDEAFTTAGKAYDAVLFSQLPSDNLAKLGMESINVSNQMTEAFKDPSTALSQLATIAGDVSKLRFLDPKNAVELYNMSGAIKKSASDLQLYKNTLVSIEEQEEKLQQTRKKLSEMYDQKTASGRSQLKTQLERAGAGADAEQGLKTVKTRIENLINTTQRSMEPHLAKLNKMQLETFARGANIIDAAILQGFAKASLTVSKAFASLLPPDTSAGISRQAELAAKDIDIQMQSMQATKELILSNERLRRQTEELAIIETRQVLMEQAKDPKAYGKTEAEISQSMQQLIVREAALAIVKTGIFEGAKGNQNLKNYRNSSSDIDQTAARDYTPTSQSLAAINAKEAQANADKLAIKIKAQADKLAVVLAIEKDIRSVEVSRLNLENTTIDSQNRLLPYLSEEVLAKKQAISEEIALNKLVDDRASIVEQIKRQQLTINNSSASKEDKAAAENAKIELTNRLIRLGKRADNEKIARNIAYTNIVMENAKKEFDARKQVSVTLNSIDVAKQNTKIALQEEYLSILTNMGAVSEEYVASQNTIIALAKEEVRSKAEILAATTAIEAAKFARKQIVESKGEGLNKEDTALQDAQIAAGEQLISNEESLSKAKKDSLIVQGKMNEAVAQQNSLMTTLTGLTETLSTLFGEAGNSMGKAMETIASTAIEYSKAQERNVVLQEKMLELQNSEGIDTDKEKLKLQKEITKNETSSYIAVAKGIATVAGAAKNMFKERSAGYKLLSAVEKAAHIATLAMQAKELASTIASIAPSIASGVSKLIAQSGWLGFAGAAAFLALMASLGYGGGGVSMPSGFDAGAQQKVQGTGQTYQDGKLVNRGGGALGDNTAKANSLNNAIDKIEEHSFSTMEYSNDMLDNLKSIKKNTEGLSAMILQSGLNTRGLDVNGEVVTGIGPRKTDSVTKTGDILSGSQLLGDIGLGNTGIGKYLDKLNTSIWGGKTKTEILDLGITFAGSINSLVKSLEDGGKGLNAIYQNVKTTVSGGWFRSDKTSITTQFQELEAIQAEAFGSIFKSIGDTVSSAAEALGKDPKITTSIMDSFEVVFKTSFEGLKPEEVTGALEAEFSNTFNDLAERVLPEFKKFRKPGEEFGDTIVRLARDVQVSALVLEASGMSIGNFAKTLGQGESIQEATVRITESLIDLSGGLEKFVSQGQFFNENFLTEAERLAPVQARVTKELSRLQSVADKSGVSIKIAGINTREGFANVVRGLDLTQTSNQELYAGLMNVAEGFAEVYEETRNTSNVLKDLKKANLDLQDQYDKLTLSEFDYIDKVTKSYTDEEKLQYRQNLALEYTIKALKMDIDYRNMEVDLLKAQGKEVEALALSRELEMKNMSRSEQIVQRLINARKDEIRIAQEATNISQKYANLEVELLRAQGKGTEALALSRERELATIDPANRALQESVYAREDEIKLLQEATNIKQKYANLEVELLRAQGKESEALALSRKIELDTIDPANRALQESVYAREDEIKLLQEANGIKQKYADLEIELLRAQGKETEAIALSRERELATIDPANRALQESVYAREDEIAAIESQKRIRQLEIDGLSAMGYSYEALVRSRAMELEGLTEAEVKLKQYIFAAQDKMVTDNLQIELMEAMGNTSAATTARRRLELRGMSAVDQQLKIRIWRLQDEKEILDKHNQQQITILELLGKKSEALALSRSLELETMDAQLRPAQQYIWALEDEKVLKDELQEAYDKQKDTLKSTISTLKDASRALKDYKAELLQSNLSVLNPQQKYAEAKQQALNLAAIATSVATTETQRLEKESAISKLPGATSAWLEASRTLYASSEAYTSDFNMVLSILDQTSAALDAQQTDAERQLAQLEASNTYLSEISNSIRPVEQILRDLVDATNKVAEAKAAVPAGTPTASSPFAVATTGASGSLQDASWVGSKGLKTTSKEIAATINSMVKTDPFGLYNKYVSEGFSSQMVDSIMGYAPGTALDWAKTLGLPAFAKGGLASGAAMVGEYGREVVDFQNPGRVYSAGNTSMMMGNTQELVSEIRALRAEVAKLREEQREQTGDLIKSNYDANGMTADTVKAANDANANNWKERNQFKLA